MALSVAALGLSLTAVVAWAAGVLNSHNEHRLLQLQTRQAATVISSSVLTVEAPLTTALQTATATDGNKRQFTRFLSADTGSGQLYAAASLWRQRNGSLDLVASVGPQPWLAPSSAGAHSELSQALHSKTFVVTSVIRGRSEHVVYALAASGKSPFIIYAERLIPPDRRVAVEDTSAFADLDFATYIGTKLDAQSLTTTDLPPYQLPISGYTARDVIPFGNTSVTLVAKARGHLGGALGSYLSWVVLIGGALLSLATAAAARETVTRRHAAEEGAATIAVLYSRLDNLYAEQRSIAETLQRALLPQKAPAVPGLEVASTYVAGAQGVEVGGDWYSCVMLDEHRLAVVVGDVSGRGLSAATVMARLRFTIRAYLVEGHPPEVVLAMCSGQLDLESDGHFATALVGVLDLATQRVTVANAGHLQPLLIAADGASFVTSDIGLPLGLADARYTPTSFDFPHGSVLVLFTDGLVERRGEDISNGLDRLAHGGAASFSPSEPLTTFINKVVASMTDSEAEDDIAVLALRWL